MISECIVGSEIPSCKIYEQFSSRNGDAGNFSTECQDLQRKFSYPGISGLCNKLSGNLINLCAADSNSSPLYYNCEFLHHWLFNEIFNNSNLSDVRKSTGVKSQFYHTWEDILRKLSCENKCEPNWILFKSLPLEELRFRKDMYEYIYNYKNFDKITTRENICNSLVAYLPSMREKYGNFKGSCPVSNNKCTHDIKSLEEYNPDNLCGRYGCQREELCAKYFQENPTERHPEVAGSLQDVKGDDARDGETPASVEESETSAILTTVGPSLLGLFIISFISFKFTPIRSWLNERLLKKRNIDEYLDDESSSEILNNYFIPENGESEKNKYGLAYYSAENMGDYNI
ncbi:PIR protein [Plasmodium ovale]|uniref:PIR Superfamily Protein n=2 Tax=Plasmodium ovale TaxID=36330 RepID=A0A1A8X4V6_PLAOA|nr:PIR Superfamily Protein [Plasmodium ovale curtisi]SBS99210.1 PIR Superfamily Protein [Plasmodium ovale curtisi]SBT85004.1 PIR protein [Plasmodium ovale]